jgi:hypothetical protein
MLTADMLKRVICVAFFECFAGQRDHLAALIPSGPYCIANSAQTKYAQI